MEQDSNDLKVLSVEKVHKMTNALLEEKNQSIRKRMMNVTEIRLVNLTNDSSNIRPLRMNYIQDGKEKIWDFMKVYDSVVVLVYNRNREKLVFVKQFRPASYCACLPNDERQELIDLQKYPPALGFTIELCYAEIDKDKSPVEIAQDKLIEKCGYEAPITAFQKITSYKFIGSLTSKETLFYVEVTDEMNTHCGGEKISENQFNEVVEMSIDEVKSYVNSEEVQSPASLLNAVSWFLLHKK